MFLSIPVKDALGSLEEELLVRVVEWKKQVRQCIKLVSLCMSEAYLLLGVVSTRYPRKLQ